MITHLATSPSGRGRGAGRALVEHLSRIHDASSGIGLHCRRDYSANGFWQRVGFVARSEREGRSREGMPLTFWWRDHAHPGLFSLSTDLTSAGQAAAAIDANVFFDLVGPERPQGQESLALRADWLQSEVILCLTDEIFNDIHRDPDTERRKQRRIAAEKYRLINISPTLVDLRRAAIRDFFPAVLDPQTSSDLEHLSRTAAAAIPYFITRDADLLRKDAAVTATVGVSILTPTEFISRLDQLRREASYRPIRLAGNIINLSLMRADEVEGVLKVFAGKEPGTLRQALRALLGEPGVFTCQIARGQTENPLAIIAHSENKHHSSFDVGLFRVHGGGDAETVARYLLHHLILQAAERGRKLIRLVDSDHEVVTRAAFEEYGFVRQGDKGLVKFCGRVVQPAAEVGRELQSLSTELFAEDTQVFKPTIDALKKMELSSRTSFTASAEQVLWPAKLVDAALPSFLISIKPTWAERLFDEGLASEMLLATGSGRLLAKEGVYYRAARRAGLSAPARIL